MHKDYDLQNLMSRLKKSDEHYSQLSKRLQIFYFILVPVYLLMLGRDIATGSETYDIIGSLLFLSGMVVFALIFRSFSKSYRDVDYSLPTLQMLEKAVVRYTPFNNKFGAVMMAVAFIGGGLYFRSPSGESPLGILITFGIALLLAMCVGLAIWWKKYKPLRDDALEIIKKINEDL